jgi:hypothetical protein
MSISDPINRSYFPLVIVTHRVCLPKPGPGLPAPGWRGPGPGRRRLRQAARLRRGPEGFPCNPFGLPGEWRWMREGTPRRRRASARARR